MAAPRPIALPGPPYVELLPMRGRDKCYTMRIYRRTSNVGLFAGEVRLSLRELTFDSVAAEKANFDAAVAVVTKWWDGGQGELKKNSATARRRGKIDAFTHAYLEAALWSSTDETRDDGGDPLDENYSIADFSPETMSALVGLSQKFQADHAGDLAAGTSEQGGHDLWLTQNGHGAGYWDGDWPEPEASRLTKAAKRIGEINLIVGDDGLIYSDRDGDGGDLTANPGGTLDAEGFAEALRSHVKLEGRQIKISTGAALAPGKSPDTLFINFYNLPTGVGRAGGGAEAENNRMMFTVRGFPKDGSPAEKVKVEMVVSALPRDRKLRAKSGTPAVIAKYLADFISKTVKEVEPLFTHTKMP